MKASISAAVTSSGASTGCKAVDRTAGRLRQDWRVADDEPKQKGIDDGKPGHFSRAGTAILVEHETPPAVAVVSFLDSVCCKRNQLQNPE